MANGREMETETITLTPPGIHVGSIVNPLSNETISIVIPITAQLTTVARDTIQETCKIEIPETADVGCQVQEQIEIKLEPNESLESATTSTSVSPISLKSSLASIMQRADKTKGCPFPTCSRYGRAFSRAHDLKRHIARHEMRKERLSESSMVDVPSCNQCGEIFLNDSILQKHKRIHCKAESVEDPSANTGVLTFPCHLCKKGFTQFNKLQAHVATHDKKSMGNLCALCGMQCENEDLYEEHMKEHDSGNFDEQELIGTLEVTVGEKPDDDDDDFPLEEMLLLNKGPRPSVPTKSVPLPLMPNGKIRCDYCSKTFKTKWTLSSHVAAHEGRFQFVCSRCGKKFVRKSHYDGHVRSHEAARPYVCEQCGKTFKELKHRREHTKRKHPGNQVAIQNLLDSISACVADDSSMESTKFTLLMPMNFTA